MGLRTPDERATDRVAQPPADGPTPIPISPRARTVLVAVGVALLVVLLSQAPSVPIVALGGAVLAIALSFPVRLLSRRMPRGLAILLTFAALVGVVLLALGLLVPALIAQISDLIRALPGLAVEAEASAREALRGLDERGLLPAEPDALLAGASRQLLPRAQGLAQGLLSGALGLVPGIFGLGVRIFGMLFVAVYLLLDVDKVKALYLRLAPARYTRDAEELWVALEHSLSRYLAGAALSLAIQGGLSALALRALGVPYPLLLGAWVSVTALIPNLGAFLGAIPAVVLALFVSPLTAVLTVLLYIGIQQLESNLLTPRIQAQAVRVHPIVVLLTVVGAAEIAGVAGAIFAVPALAVLRVLWDFFRARIVVR
jgi:predicted PurR-regulated permease PerM